ncbi:hypothetical protein KUTeg_020712 [Tegillarca granosa]|uniref:Caveolin n=1 Tax=Tegillarca granosa TaxID=220873 RepID=A0ABQ9EE77_TEGGR|nr:hypothetical protein KUTeg_020712 [Tegillarca granosa]
MADIDDEELPPQDALDLIARDPNKINDHIRVDFDDVLAEADGTHSINCVWKGSHKCYMCGKNFCYNMCTFFMGIFISFYWGMMFAYITFIHIWCCTPVMRMFVLQCNMMQKCCGTIVNCFLAPTAEACGLFFSNIVVHNS